jgi:hypothetical protein
MKIREQKFFKNLADISKFYAPESGHETISILSTKKKIILVATVKVYSPRPPAPSGVRITER